MDLIKRNKHGQCKKAKNCFATGLGNAMEWFDFGLYSYLAVIISQNFFSSVEMTN